jgi:hypothetical protein
MSFFTQKLLIPTIKTALLATLSIVTMQLMTGCGSQSLSSNNNVTAQTADTDKGMDKKEETSVNLVTTDSITTDKIQAITVENIADEKMVSPLGYQKLSFGQVVTPELLNDLGMTRAESDNKQCYYVNNPALSYMDQEYGKRASVLYQIIDNKVALITIQDPNIPFYKDIKVGDAVADVMKAHHDELTYEVDKYAVAGDYYSLIANVNFKIIKENAQGEWLKDENIELNYKQDKLPIQIEYHIKGGQKLNDYRIQATEWTTDNKILLTGVVKSIDIGIPEAIYLVEGCS